MKIKIINNNLINNKLIIIIINKEIKYNNGRYVGQVVNGKRKEKEFIILIMEIDMKVIGKMIKGKEKEFIIIIMEIDMKVILKMIKEKEKEFIILIMVDMKVILKI